MSVPSSELAPPALSPASECVPPPEPEGGGGQHSLAGEGRGKPIRTTREKAWHSVYAYIRYSRENSSRPKSYERKGVVHFTFIVSCVQLSLYSEFHISLEGHEYYILHLFTTLFHIHDR